MSEQGFRPALAGLRQAFGLRRLVSDRIARMIDWRIDNRIPPERFAAIHRRLDNIRQDLDKRTEEHRRGQREAARRLREAEQRVQELQRKQRWSVSELERIIPQVAGQESQLEALREKLAVVPAADAPEVEAARSLIEEVRREHSQIKVRLTAVAQYEDRLRKLEDTQ